VDIQASMLCAIVKSNTNADEFMMERYREARFDATIKTRLRNSLACRNLASDLQYNTIHTLMQHWTWTLDTCIVFLGV